jgi:hypothetical protein
MNGWLQGCTNPGRRVARATKFCMVATNICGSSVWNLLHFTLLASRILRWLLNFWKICALLYAWMDGWMDGYTERWWNGGDGKPKCSEKVIPSLTSTAINLTWTGLVQNPGFRGERPEINLPSFGMRYPVSFSHSHVRHVGVIDRRN